MQIAFTRLKEIVNQSCYSNDGDGYEEKYQSYFTDSFLNSETFWKLFIVPYTLRIDESIPLNHHSKIKPRMNISKDLQEIGCFHYSVFLNVSWAHKVFESKHDSFFENFYTHLGSICDSTEEFLIKVYFLILDCTEGETEILQSLSKRKFLEIAKEWYDENYHKVFEHYLKKGKPGSPQLLARKYVLDEYFDKFQPWKKYKSFTQKIKEYRNVTVHNYQIGTIQDSQGRFYVPKKERILDYKNWNEVSKAVNNPQKFHSHFIEREKQMQENIEEFKQILNSLWEKPIEDLKKLLYIDKNEKILAKYDIQFS
jgi:hypothetical protein